MANLQDISSNTNLDPTYWIPAYKILIENLTAENKRLKKLAHDLQHEIEVKVLESRETHELEEK